MNLWLKRKNKTGRAPPPNPSGDSTFLPIQGLQILSQGSNPIIDIVAIHGLNGHAEKTWTASNGIHWLRDLLPHDLPSARIFTWGYDANTHDPSRASQHYLYDHAVSLVSDLCLERKLTKTSRRPILFVAHSLGGIILKSALIHSDAARRGALEEHRSIKLSTHAIVFMGTPHQGGNGVALGEIILQIASTVMPTNKRLLQHLKRDSEWLQQQLRQYGPISGDFITKYAYEEYATSTAFGHSLMVVPRASAVVPGMADAEPIVIHADHTNMVKFASPADEGYRKISGHLQILAESASDMINLRWETEDRMVVAITNDSRDFAASFRIPEVSENGFFVGREEELFKIREHLQNGLHRKSVILHGLGGIGKTQLAIRYAVENRHYHSAVFFLNSRDIGTLKQCFLTAARQIVRDHPSLTHLRAIIESNDLEEAVEAVKDWLNMPENTRWLLIYDNYDNPKLPGSTSPHAYAIRPFLPEADQGSLIFTTRSSQFRYCPQIHVKKFCSIEHGLAILSHMSGRDNLEKDLAAHELVRMLDGLPLALATAGAYLYQVSTSLPDYIHLYQNSWLRLQQKTPQLLSYEDRAFYSTWEISLEHVQQKSPVSAKILQLWAYFDNQDVWFELLADCQAEISEWFTTVKSDRLDFDEAMRVLCDHGLIELDPVSGIEPKRESLGYSMHPCVHSWTRNVLNTTWEPDLVKLAMQCVGNHTPSRRSPECWASQQRLMRHATRSLELLRNMGLCSDPSDSALLESVTLLGKFHKDQSKFKEAEEIFKWVLGSARKNREMEPRIWYGTLQNLANIYMKQGKFNEAEDMYHQILQGGESQTGAGQLLVLDTTDKLGILYRQQGSLCSAETWFLQALHRKEDTLGSANISTIHTVHNLGDLYTARGDFEKAENFLQRAITNYEAQLGLTNTYTLASINGLGLLRIKQGRLGEASTLLHQALEGYEKSSNPNNMSLLEVVDSLGSLYRRQGNSDEAEKKYKRALEGFERVLGPSHARCQQVREALITLEVSQNTPLS